MPVSRRLLHASQFFLLFQSTDAHSQSPATYRAVGCIILAARKLNAGVHVLVVYTVPQRVAPRFRAPACELLAKTGARAVVGFVDDETDLMSNVEREVTEPRNCWMRPT